VENVVSSGFNYVIINPRALWASFRAGLNIYIGHSNVPPSEFGKENNRVSILELLEGECKAKAERSTLQRLVSRINTRS